MDASGLELPRDTDVRFRIYGVTGRLVRTLIELASPLVYQLRWDGRDDGGRPAPSGTHFLRLRADGSILTRKMRLLK